MAETELKPVKPEPVVEDKEYLEIIKSLLGKTVTVVNPESYEHAPVGFTLKAGFYRAKVTGMGKDFITVVTEMKKAKADSGDPVKQFIPLCHIKRISVMKLERLIHI
jgi:hypothetical protein